jgi:hypothetical protein
MSDLCGCTHHATVRELEAEIAAAKEECERLRNDCSVAGIRCSYKWEADKLREENRRLREDLDRANKIAGFHVNWCTSLAPPSEEEKK